MYLSLYIYEYCAISGTSLHLYYVNHDCIITTQGVSSHHIAVPRNHQASQHSTHHIGETQGQKLLISGENPLQGVSKMVGLTIISC